MNQPPLKPLILLVDDDPSIRLFCSATLKKAGYGVLEAEGSCEAMACQQSSKAPIDLLLSDLFLPPPDFQMRSASMPYPRVNGHELVNQALSVQQELRVLLMSSQPLASLTGQGIAVHPEHFLHKPFSADDLLQHVAKALASEPIRLETPTPAPAGEVRWAD
jgi:CheY-like chemotaxis protein